MGFEEVVRVLATDFKIWSTKVCPIGKNSSGIEAVSFLA